MRDGVAGDLVRGQEGAQGEQVGRGRGLLAEPVEGELPGHRDGRVVRVGHPRAFPQGRVRAVEQLAVVVDGAAGALDVGGRVLEGERVVAQLAGQGVGAGLVVQARAPEQEAHRFLARPHLDGQRRGDPAPGGIARGQDHVPCRPARQVVAQLGWLRRVVEHEQPAAVALEPPADGLDDEALVFGILNRQVERAGEVGEVGGEPRRLLGGDPPDEVVVGGVAVAELDGELGLAHPAEPVDSLGNCRRPRLERLGEPREQRLAASEARVPLVRHVPDRRQRARESRLPVHRPRRTGREGRRARRLGAVQLDPREQGLARGRVVESVQLDPRDGVPQSLRLAGAHAHGEQLAPRARRVLGDGRGPLGLGVERTQVAGRQDGEQAGRRFERPLHVEHEVLAGPEVPRHRDDRVAGVVELPGDPLGPAPVRAGVADEEVCPLGVHGPPPSGGRSIRAPAGAVNGLDEQPPPWVPRSNSFGRNTSAK